MTDCKKKAIHRLSMRRIQSFAFHPLDKSTHLRKSASDKAFQKKVRLSDGFRLYSGRMKSFSLDPHPVKSFSSHLRAENAKKFLGRKDLNFRQSSANRRRYLHRGSRIDSCKTVSLNSLKLSKQRRYTALELKLRCEVFILKHEIKYAGNLERPI